MQMFLASVLAAACFGLTAIPAAAREAPQPAKPVSASFFSGRWYEIARTTNKRQGDCEAPTYDFGKPSGGNIGFVLTCRRGSPDGKAEAAKVTVKLPTDERRNKFRVSVLGGALSTDYWVLDRAEDHSWAIMATPGGNYVWILSRRPNMDQRLHNQLMSRIRGWGYDISRIVMPRHG
jgi:apolipoprotein D and lipocalin family protein